MEEQYSLQRIWSVVSAKKIVEILPPSLQRPRFNISLMNNTKGEIFLPAFGRTVGLYASLFPLDISNSLRVSGL
jgi:hypothetical protein